MDKLHAYQQLCRGNALHVLQLAWSDVPEAGFERCGVQWLNDYIELSLPYLSDDLTDEFCQLMGSFYGECLIAAFGGSWKVSGQQLGVWTPGYGFSFPFRAVRRQINGEHSANVAQRYAAALAHHTTAASEVSAITAA